jgi:hypothetical protein
MGAGGPAVDTVLDNPESRPRESLAGAVRLPGGERAAEIERIVLRLLTRDGTTLLTRDGTRTARSAGPRVPGGAAVPETSPPRLLSASRPESGRSSSSWTTLSAAAMTGANASTGRPERVDRAAVVDGLMPQIGQI